MTPYHVLKNAVRRRGGVATAYEVRRELTAYLDWQSGGLKRWGQKFWAEVMTRDEWFALANRRKKRKRRTKQGELIYTNIEDHEVTVHPDPLMEQMSNSWAAEVDEFAAQMDREEAENGYWGTW